MQLDEISPELQRFYWCEETQKHRVGIIFETEAAKIRALEIAAQQWDCSIHAVMSKARCDKNKLKEILEFEIEHYGEIDPIEFLAGIDEIYLIEDSSTNTSTISSYM